MRTPIIAANWKMNKTVREALAFANDFSPLVAGTQDIEIVLCPAFTALHPLAHALADTPIGVGGQNCYTEESGAYTGEVSPQMLREAGADWVIVGHSERRQLFGESDAYLNEKLRFALASGMKVIFCIGETLEERENGEMDPVLRRQIEGGLADVAPSDLDRVVIAYEPVWAIGTGKTATPHQAEEAHEFVRGLLSKQYNETVADTIRIQYGGSVKPDNAAELLGKPNVDGALVGGASLDPQHFAAIVNAGAKTAV